MTTTTSRSRRDFLRRLGTTLCAGTASAFVPQMKLMGSALAATTGTTFTDYRAIVCVYLAGGNDSWNLLIPTDARHSTYLTSRGQVYDPASNPGGLGIALNTLVPLAPGGVSNGLGLHPSCADGTYTNGSQVAYQGLASHFNAGRVAILQNIGTLVRPITKAEYNSNLGRPPQLYSHNDQETLWHLGRTDPTFTLGWGGQIADRVRGDNLFQTLSPCISIQSSGSPTRFEVGADTFPYQIGTNGVTAQSSTGTTGNNGARNTAIANMLAASHGSPFATEYGAIMQRSRDIFDVLNTELGSANGTIAQIFPSTSLGNQLQMAARMIKLSRNAAGPVNHRRQIYLVRLGGFDTHDLQFVGNNSHANLLLQLTQALGAFWNALGEIGAQNEVTTFTMSEFARTLTSNGDGSDHAWGGVQLAMGGAVTGGLYGNFPDQTLNGPVSLSRGQFIPDTAVDQMGATLAKWIGVQDAELGTIFPNLGAFAAPTLGFLPG
jgi:uncharacterized protein (DUF1501 family)